MLCPVRLHCLPNQNACSCILLCCAMFVVLEGFASARERQRSTQIDFPRSKDHLMCPNIETALIFNVLYIFHCTYILRDYLKKQASCLHGGCLLQCIVSQKVFVQCVGRSLAIVVQEV